MVKLNMLGREYSKVSDDYVIDNHKLVDLKTGKTPNTADSYDKTYHRERYCLRRKDGKGSTSIDASKLKDVIEENFL